MIYTPDRWVVLAITTNNIRIEKVFAGWKGGYLGSDSWKLSSEIAVAELSIDNKYYTFITKSGNVYKCYKSLHGGTAYMFDVLQDWQNSVEKYELNATFKVIESYRE